MSPDNLGPAIARLLMLTAGPADAYTTAIRDELGAFDTIDDVAALAIATAQAAAEKFTDRASIYIADGADLLAFGMISPAAEHGTDGLDELLDGMPYSHRAAIAIGLLAMWRQACAAAATVALATITVPETLPEETP
jgi:hypothetical protein